MKKYISMLILCGMLLSMAVSCSSETSAETETNGVTDTVAVTETETETNITDTLTDADYEGHTFKILSADCYGWWQLSVDADEMNGEILNDTVFERNMAVEERYNVVITDTVLESAEITSIAKRNAESGSDEYDMIHNWVKVVLASAPDGYYYNLYNVDSIDFENPWWSSQCIDPLTTAGKMFVAFNSMEIQLLETLGGYYFNNDLIIDNGLEDPYTLVREGRWTLDKMHDMAEAVKADVDGDGAMTEADQYGFITGKGDFNSMVNGAEQPHVKKDETGKLILNYGTEGAINAAEKIARLVNAEFSVYLNEQGWGRDAFNAGRGLFASNTLSAFREQRDLEIDLGIVPIPKYDEVQKNYHSMMSNCSMGVTIPVIAADPERTGVIVEALGAYSMGTLDTAYYDTVLLGKYSRNPDCTEMIKIIKNSQTVDVGVLNENSFGSVINSWLDNMRKNRGEGIASVAASQQKAFDTVVQKIENAYAAMP